MKLGSAMVLAVLCLAGCSSVELPRERYWRLDLPTPAGGELPRGGVLRVQDLQLGNALNGDHLLVAHSAAELEPCLTEHWIAPLDRLVTDAVVLGLSRTRMFTLVKGAGDAGLEDCTLHGRIVDFAEHRTGPRPTAVVVFEFWAERRDEIRFQDEFIAKVPLAGDRPADAVAALSTALQQVLDELVGRMRASGLMTQAIESMPPK